MVGEPRAPGAISRWFGRAGGRRAAWRRQVARRCLTAGLVGLAAYLALQVLSPPPPQTRPVLVAAQGISAGETVAQADITIRPYALDLAPAAALSDPSAVVGRRVTGPIGAGEVVTATRVLGPGLLDSLPAGSVAIQVEASAGAAAVLRPGVRVDGYLAGRDGAVVTDALVLAVLAPGSRESGLLGGASGGAGAGSSGVVLAVSDSEARRIVAGQDPATGGTVLTFAAR